jgi:hypothetical protein
VRRFIALAVVSLALLLTLSGCMYQAGTGSVNGSTLQGTVTGWPIGSGTFAATISFGTPPELGLCVPATISVVLTDTAGNNVNKQETGNLCAPSQIVVGASYVFTGDYVVTGGTGPYQGATGSGFSTIDLVIGQGGHGIPTLVGFRATEIGTFQTAGAGSASATRERTVKMQGTVKHLKLSH